MKIAYCILGTFNSGGMERVLANKANYFVKLGYEVSIITTDQQNRVSYFELDSRIKQYDLGINYTDNNQKGIINKILDFPKKQLRHKKFLKNALFKIRPDITITLFDHDANLLYKIKDGSKKVAEIHFSRYKRLQYGRKGLWKLIDFLRSNNDLKLAERYDKFIVLTQEDKTYWKGLSNIEVIPNANSFKVSDKADLINERVIAVGRYDFQKGFEDLIKAWDIVHKELPNWSLDIFGKGPLEAKYKKLISDLNLQTSINLRDPVSNIKDQYLSSSIVALTSKYEGLPMVLLEAQCCGLPLISYACKCGPRDIIEDGVNGIIVPEGNIPAMASALIKVASNKQLRNEMGEHSFRMSDKYAEDRIMQLWILLFDNLIK